jgi:iron complex outermembrane recepter protein
VCTTNIGVALATLRAAPRSSKRITSAASLRIMGMAMVVIALAFAGGARTAAAQEPTEQSNTMNFDSARTAALKLHNDSLRAAGLDTVVTRKTRADTARLTAVTITATPPAPNEPYTAITITQAQIATAPANSPYELLRQTTGLEAHEQGQGPGFASDISVRGFSSDHSTDIALWIDGVPINQPVNGHAEGYNDFNLIFPQAVTGIDVLKGPVSALYGNFAFSGVIDVRTVEHMDGTQFQLSGGQYGNYQGSLLTGFESGGTSGVLGIRGWHDDGWRVHSQYNLGQLHARLVQQLSSITTLDFGVELYATEYQSPGFLDTLSYLNKDYNIVSNFGDGGFKRYAQERVSLGVQFTPDMLWRTTLYGTQDTWNFWLSTPPGLGGLLEGSGVETREYDGRYGGGGTTALTYSQPGECSSSLSFCRSDISFGAQIEYTSAHYENWAEAVEGFREDSAFNALVHAQQLSGGLFLQTNFNVSKYLRFSLGGRVDQLSSTSQQPDSSGNQVCSNWNDPKLTLTCSTRQYSKGVFSPKTGVLLQPIKWFGVYANISKGWRQQDGVILDVTTPLIYVWQYETGVAVTAGENFSFDASVFRMQLSNSQEFNGVSSLGGGPSVRKGIDFTGNWVVIPGLTLHSAWTILDAYYTKFIDPGTGTNYSGYPVFNTSQYTGIFTVNETPPHSIWQFQLGTNFLGPYTPFEETPGLTRPGFALLNGFIGAKVAKDWTLSLACRNILDTQYRELESGYFITPGQVRTAYLQLSYGY